MPIIPGLSKAGKAKQQTPPLAQPPSLPPPATAEEVQSSEAASHSAADAEASQVRMDEVVTPPPKAAPKSWADLVRSKNASVAAANAIESSSLTNGAVPSRAGSLRDVLSEFNVDSEGKIAFIEPRGLVNMGNMCYMNSVRGPFRGWSSTLIRHRFFRYLCSVYLFTISWIRSANGQRILSKAIPLLLMPCE